MCRLSEMHVQVGQFKVGRCLGDVDLAELVTLKHLIDAQEESTGKPTSRLDAIAKGTRA